MKIASIELYELRVPLKKPFTRSKKIGTLVDCTPIVCKLITKDGLVGIGETNPVMPLTSEDAAVVIHVIREYLAPAVLGSGFSRKSAIAFMIIPGLQNPHCSAPCPAIKEPNSSASSCSPSSVSTLCPSALAASTEQESTGFSSKNTVQSPQLEVSQPRFTL